MIRDLSICPTARAVLEGSDADGGEAPVQKTVFCVLRNRLCGSERLSHRAVNPGVSASRTRVRGSNREIQESLDPSGRVRGGLSGGNASTI